ncbi:MAG: DUF4011 domain-containing protein [Granulosicoccus sp.]
MEVLRGNQIGSKHSRRRSDRYALAENRLLDWSIHESDIALLPHSPLALADVLSQRGGYLDLVPRPAQSGNADFAPAEALDSAASLPHSPSRDNKRSSRQRFNLLTRHSEAELLRLCKKILVENALIKNKGDRQLYLAAGFVSWPMANKPEERQRAPLLLYPALLVRIPEEQRYEIRLAGDTPEYNIALVQHIEQLHDCSLPGFDEDMPLVELFAQTAESLQSASSLELEFDIALGNAAFINAEFTSAEVRLPDIPAHFNGSLAMSITGNQSLEQLKAVLQLIPDFRLSEPANPDCEGQKSVDRPAMNGAARLRRYSAKLAAEGLDHVEFRQLPALPSLMGKWTESMKEAVTTKTVADVLEAKELSARELIKLAGIIELIDKAPDSIEQWGHGDLCYANSTALLRRAQHQAKLIEDELQALQEHFQLDKVPAKSQLLSLMNELGGHVENEPDLVDADYFNARRQFMEFSTRKAAHLTAEHRRSLSQLAKVLRFRELFVNNVEYRAALGKGYKGLRTDWPMLIKSSDYARELTEVIGSETLAASIINNWEAFRNNFSCELETLQHAAEGTRRLLGIVGKRWQTQPVSALSTHVALVAARLQEWKEQYGTVESHAEKTAATILSSFSGQSMDHVLVESQVDEVQSRIRQQLLDGKITIEQINNTVSWLTQAVSIASEHDLEIESIVEHLQIE